MKKSTVILTAVSAGLIASLLWRLFLEDDANLLVAFVFPFVGITAVAAFVLSLIKKKKGAK